MQLLQILLHVLYGVVSLLDLLDRVQYLPPALLLNCLLQKRFALAGGDEDVERFLVGILAGDGVVPALYGLPVLEGDLLAEGIEALHGILELLPEAVDDGDPGPVGGRTRTAAGKAPVGGVGAIEGLEADLDHFGLLESESDVGVHARSEVLDGVGVVERLALLVSGLEILVDALQLLELVFNRLGVSEELVEVDTGRRRRGHLDHVLVVVRLAAEPREGAREEVVHRR